MAREYAALPPCILQRKSWKLEIRRIRSSLCEPCRTCAIRLDKRVPRLFAACRLVKDQAKKYSLDKYVAL